MIKKIHCDDINIQILLNENAFLKAENKRLKDELFGTRMDHSILMDFTIPHLHELIKIKSQTDPKIRAHSFIKDCMLSQGWNIASVLSGQNRSHIKLVYEDAAIMICVNLNGARSWTSDVATIIKVAPCQR